jgi:hypothetical protein
MRSFFSSVEICPASSKCHQNLFLHLRQVFNTEKVSTILAPAGYANYRSANTRLPGRSPGVAAYADQKRKSAVEPFPAFHWSY